MSDPPLIEQVALVVLAILAAGAIVARRPRLRGALALGAGVLAPVLLAASIWDGGQLDQLKDRPLVAALAVAALLVALGAAAYAVRRWPIALPVAAIVALPFRVPVSAGEGEANLLVPLYLVIGAGVLADAVPRLLGRGGRARAPGALEWTLAAFVVVYAVQALYSSDFERGLQQMCFFLAPFALLYALLGQMRWGEPLRRLALVSVAALATAFAAIGIVQYATREVLFNPRLLASNELESYFRVNSLFFDPNVFGRFEVLAIVLLAAVVLWTADVRRALRAAAVACFAWVGMLFSFSQSSFVSLLAGLAVLAGLRYRARWVIAPVAAAIAAGVVVLVAAPGLVGIDTGQRGALERATSGRLNLAEGGAELFLDRPVAGYGAGSFGREYRRRDFQSDAQAASVSHTIPVTIAAEQGAIGLLAYVALLAAAVWTLFARSRGSPARAAVAAAFVALVVHTLLYAAFLEDPATWALLAAGSALAVAPRSAAQRRIDRERRGRRRTVGAPAADGARPAAGRAATAGSDGS